MSTPMFNHQRGVSFDPMLAKVDRESRELRQAAEARRQVAAAARQARADAKREHARMLDQVEASWRERARDRRHG